MGVFKLMKKSKIKITFEESTTCSQDNLVSSDQLVVSCDQGQVMEQSGNPQVPDGRAPAGGVIVPLEPQHLPRQ